MKRFLVGLNVVLLVCAGLPEGHSQTFTPGQVLTAGALNTAFALANANASAVQAASLQKTNNLSDLNNAATARNNLGLGTAATQPYSAFDVNGAATAAIAGQMPGNALTATYAVGAGTASNVPYTGLTGSVPTWNQNTTGTAAAASALAATPANCGVGNYATGINAAGSAVGCASAAGAYQLPTATPTVLGGTKPDGTTITNNAGAISVTYGTTAGTAAQGNDSRIVSAVQSGGALGTPSSGTATNLTGTAAGLTSGNTSNVSGQTAAAVAAAAVMVQSATASNVPSTIVMRDASGVINASAINASGGSLNNVILNNASFVPALGPYVTSVSCSTSSNPLLACSVTNSTTVPLVDFELTAGSNTLLGNITASSSVPTAITVPSCSGTGSALDWTTSAGFTCNTALTVAAPTGSGASGTNVPYTVAIGIDPVVVAEYYYASSVPSGALQGDVMIGSAVPQTVTLSGTCTAASTTCVATVGNTASTFVATDIPAVATSMAKVITVYDATNSRYASMYINTVTNAYTGTFTVGANAITTGAYTANNWTYGWPMAYAYPNAWLELPANTLASSVTGYGTTQLWYATCSLTTLCQVTTTSVLPNGITYFTPTVAARPVSPVISTGGATATTISTGTNYHLANIKIPANTLGSYGRLKVSASWSNSGSPANKVPSVSYSSWFFWQQNLAATTEWYSSLSMFQNRGATNSQLNLTSSYTASFGGQQNAVYATALISTIDSTVDEPLYLNGAIATTSANGDTVALEGFNVEIWPHN